MNRKHILRIIFWCLVASLYCGAISVSAETLKIRTADEGLLIENNKLLLTTDTQKCNVRAYYGSRIVTRKASWKSSNTSVAIIGKNGCIKVKNGGVTKITCRYKGRKRILKLVVVTNTHKAGIPASKEEYIEVVSLAAKQLYPYTGILPSVVIAQCCLETGYGLGKDAVKLVKKNNLLGMKSELLNESWSQYSVWDGRIVKKKTPEYLNGKMVTITDSFRAYPDYLTCILDYEQFLLHVKYRGKYKYRSIVGKTSPKKVITRISKSGYATDPSYITKVLKLISENTLTQFDR